MPRARHDVHIHRPIAEVFDFLADGSNNPRWQRPVVRTSRVGVELGTGTVFHQSVRQPLGFTVSADYRISAFERPVRLEIVVTSGGPVLLHPLFAWEAAWVEQARAELEATPAAPGGG